MPRPENVGEFRTRDTRPRAPGPARRRPRARALVLSLAALAVLAPGCRTKEGPPTVPPIYKNVTPGDLARRQAARDGRISSLRAYARVKVVGPRRKFGFSEAISVARPDAVRLDTVGPFGRVFSILATDGGSLRFVSPGDRRMYAGAPTAENLGRFLPFTLRIEDIVAVFLGGCPEPAGEGSLVYEPSDATLRLRTANRSGSSSLAVYDARTLDLRQLQIIDPPPAIAAVLDYDSWKPANGILYPQRLRVSVPARQVTMTIHFERVEPNAPIGGDLFALRAPKGFEVIPIEKLPPAEDQNLAPASAATAVDSPEGEDR